MIFNKNWKLFIMFGGGKPQWTFLQHNGPLFPAPYKPHRIPVIVNNEELILTPLAEEYATMYARFIDTDYVNNPKFKKNFWVDFKSTVANLNINNLDEIDFSLIKKHLIKEKEKKKYLSVLVIFVSLVFTFLQPACEKNGFTRQHLRCRLPRLPASPPPRLPRLPVSPASPPPTPPLS